MKKFNNYLRSLSGIFLFALLLTSCTKSEGLGGSSSIKGTVTVEAVDLLSGDPIETYPAKEKRVYIIYGENEIYSDEMRTNYDGQFEFPHLRSGNYTIYTYSDCDNCAGGETEIFIDVEITSSKQIINTGEITITKLID